MPDQRGPQIIRVQVLQVHAVKQPQLVTCAADGHVVAGLEDRAVPAHLWLAPVGGAGHHAQEHHVALVALEAVGVAAHQPGLDLGLGQLGAQRHGDLLGLRVAQQADHPEGLARVLGLATHALI